jgi:LPXTG-motif cell wall-anchored protein
MIRNLLRPRLFGMIAAAGVATLLLAGPAMASSSPSISVSPSSGLTSGKSVTVNLSGFTANASIAVIQCSPLVATQGQAACNTAGVKLLSAGSTGAATTTLSVVTGQVGTASGSTCPGQGGICLITAANTTNQAENASAQVTFAAAATATPVPGATTPSTGKPIVGEVLLAAGLVVLGGGLLVVTRRRAAHH